MDREQQIHPVSPSGHARAGAALRSADFGLLRVVCHVVLGVGAAGGPSDAGLVRECRCLPRSARCRRWALPLRL